MKSKPTGRSLTHNQRGIAMLLVLVAVAVAAVLSLTFLSAQATSTGIARNVNRHAQARAITESGLLMALHQVQTNANWRTDYSSGVWATNQAFSGGNFTIWGEDGQDTNGDGIVDGDGDLADDSSDPVTLTATGKFESVTHTAQLVVTPPSESGGSSSIFTMAVHDKIRLDGKSLIDSFDSSRGAYGGQNKSSNAVVSTNSRGHRKIYLKHYAKIMGDAYVGAGGNPKKGILARHHAKVTGDRKVLTQNVPMPNIKLPSLGLSNSGYLVYSSGTTTINSDLLCDGLEIKNNAVVEIRGNVTIIAKKKLKLAHNAKLKILDGSTLTIYTRYRFEVYNNARINYDSADPTRLTFYHMSSKPIYLWGNTKTYATIVAPRASLKMKYNPQLYGTVLAKKIELNVNAQIHQDISSAVGGGSNVATVRWVEQ